MKEKKLKLERKEEAKKFPMLKCWVTAVEDGYIVMRPILKSPIGLKGSSITYSTKDENIFKIKEEVLAFNVHLVKAGWRAKKVLKSAS